MNSRPFISVIIPTFNRAKYLKECIDSVLNQTYKKFEIIVVDDGSTDETKDILEKYQDKVVTLFQSNHGVGHARNAGVARSKGDWLAFLDSDDYWLENKLETQYELLLDDSDLKWLHCDEIWIRNGVRVNPKKKHKKPSGDIFENCMALCCVSPSAVMIEKNFYDDNGGFRNDFPVCEDYDLWLKLSRKEPIGFVEKSLVVKRGGHEDQLSRYIGLDLFRIEALVWQLENSELSENEIMLIKSWIKKRFSILEKGYEKHNKTNELYELQKKYGEFI